VEIDITETMSRWVENREKTWHTVRKPKIIVMAGYTMHLLLSPRADGGTRVLFGIEYRLPGTHGGRVAGWILGPR
jgi:hypothetical protein